MKIRTLVALVMTLSLAALAPAAMDVARAAAAAKPAKPAAAPAKPAAAPATAEANKVDINSATKDQLMKLPAIGEAIAGKIIAGRPWANKAQLLSKNVLTKAAYDKVAPLIVAKQAGK